MTIGVGSKLGAYSVIASLRVGGMASLFLGKREGAAGFAKQVAIKVVHPHLTSDPTFVQMFVDEAMISARVVHPNVVHVEELGEAEGTYFLVMEYVLGVTLWQLLKGLADQGRRIAPALAVHIAAHVADGLHAAHETRGDDGALLGLVHRDISPQNVLISSGGHVKLIDFGVAKTTGRAQETTAGTLKGKLGYMPPEQAFGRPIDRRTDVYALGVVLWEMLAGRRLFKADNDFALLEMVRAPNVAPPSQFAQGISPALDAVVLRALAPNVDARFASAAELRSALLEALPQALRVDSARLADLVGASCAKLLERERKLLAQATGRAMTSVPPPALQSIDELTVSDSRIRLEIEQSASGMPVPPGVAPPSPSATPVLSSTPSTFATPVGGSPVREVPPRASWRWVAAVAVVVGCGAAIAIGLIALGNGASDGMVATPLASESSALPPVGLAPVELAPPVAPVEPLAAVVPVAPDAGIARPAEPVAPVAVVPPPAEPVVAPRGEPSSRRGRRVPVEGADAPVGAPEPVRPRSDVPIADAFD